MRDLWKWLLIFSLTVSVSAAEKTWSILQDGVEFVGLGVDRVLDGGSILMDFGNSDNTRTYILVRNRDPKFGAQLDYQQFYISDEPRLKNKKEIFEDSEVEKIILAKAEKFHTSDRSNERIKQNLHQLIQLIKNRKLQWWETDGTWTVIRKIDTSHPLVKEVIITGSDVQLR